jgi:acetyl-CoA acetyltransferase
MRYFFCTHTCLRVSGFTHCNEIGSYELIYIDKYSPTCATLLLQVNPNGGAIALGHPLGCTGARQTATLLHELRRTGGRYGVVSMCIGTGMGAAAVFEAEPASYSRL